MIEEYKASKNEERYWPTYKRWWEIILTTFIDSIAYLFDSKNGIYLFEYFFKKDKYVMYFNKYNKILI